MKYVITESKLNKVIQNYLNKNYIPDIGWGPEIFEFVEDQIEVDTSYRFTVDNFTSYIFFGETDSDTKIKPKTLHIVPDIANDLTDLFDDRWHSIFVDWFENGTGLDVDHLDI
jgi:hypothetical protein